MWVVMLEGKDQGEHFLTIGEVLEKGSFSQEYPKPASVYEKFDDSGRSERRL
jgi:hypothetical protein